MDDHKPTPKLVWSRLGGQLGVGLCSLGFLLVFLGWNGAASVDRVPSQFPYLISGGVAGLCFVVLGVGMLVVQNQRADRAALQTSLRELQEAMERAGLAQGSAGQRSRFAPPGPRLAVAPTALAPAATDGDGDDTVEVPRPVDPGDERPRRAPRKAPARTTNAGAPRPRATKAGGKTAKTSKPTGRKSTSGS